MIWLKKSCSQNSLSKFFNGQQSKLVVWYKVNLVSLIKPFCIKTSSLYSTQQNRSMYQNESVGKAGKLLLKQSYMLLVWFNKLKNFLSKSVSEKSIIPSFSFLPKSNRKYTKTKSPMAQKTFSQEQYHYQYYNLTISFTSLKHQLSTKSRSLNSFSINEVYYLILTTQYLDIPFSTNLLFLKRFLYLISFHPKKYLVFRKNR